MTNQSDIVEKLREAKALIDNYQGTNPFFNFDTGDDLNVLLAENPVLRSKLSQLITMEITHLTQEPLDTSSDI